MNSEEKRFNRQLSRLAGFTIAFFVLLLALSVPAVVRDWSNLQNSTSETLNEKKEKFNASLEIVKSIVGGAGTVATVAGGFVLYLNFREASRNTELSEARLITERFAKAIEQLGYEKLEVCLGGIYSLEKIAMDSKTYHWTIVEVLATFVRERSRVVSSGKYALARKAAIQAALIVIGRRDITQDPSGRVVDLSNANLSEFTLNGNFSRINFRESEFQKAKLRGEFEHADFRDADLKEADLSGTNFKYAIFADANLNFTKIVNANLNSADLRGAFLHRADLESTNLEKADMRNTFIEGAVFRKAKLKDSNLSNADAGLEPACWERRHWTDEDYFVHDYTSEAEDYDDDGYYIPDFRLAEGLTVQQIQAVKGYEKAMYDKSFRQQLGLPNCNWYDDPESPDESPSDN
jgi:hypothetical protein